MRTEDLITLLSEDAPVRLRLGRLVAFSLAIGIAVSAAILLSTIGLRTNIAEAIETKRVIFKIATTTLLAVLASRLLFRVARPAAALKPFSLLLLIPLVLAVAAVTAELFAVPSESWRSRMVGNNALFCLFFVPVLALAPLAVLLLALRHGAPANPGLAGASAGLAAGAIACAAYAWHCADDSPLFVSTWYTIALAVVTALGYFAGRRVLRW